MPIGSRTLVEQRRDRRLALDRAPRAVRARGPRHARPPAHLRRPRADDRGLPLLHLAARAAGRRAAAARGRPQRRARRARLRAAPDRRGARAGHRPAGRRLGAVARHDGRAPRRARAAAAAARDGGRDHGLGRRRQAPLRVRAGRRRGPPGVGARLHQRVDRRPAPGRAHAAPAALRSLARQRRARHPRAPRAGLHAARRRGLALPRRRGRACSPTCATASSPRCARS